MHEFWVIVVVTTVIVAAQFFSRFRAMRVTRDAQEASEKHDATDINVNSRSPQGVCRRLAATLEANAIVVERARDEIVVVAGAPWKIEVEPLDKIALDWSFTTGLPPKSGGGNPFCSDWLFLPILVGGKVVAVLGVVGRYGRRRFILDGQPTIRIAVSALQRIYQSRVSQRSGELHRQSDANITAKEPCKG
jgi:hypothetical protein